MEMESEATRAVLEAAGRQATFGRAAMQRPWAFMGPRGCQLRETRLGCFGLLGTRMGRSPLGSGGHPDLRLRKPIFLRSH